MVNRERALTIRMSDEDMQMVVELAEHMQRSQSDAVRVLIRTAHAKAGLGSRKPRRRKR